MRRIWMVMTLTALGACDAPQLASNTNGGTTQVQPGVPRFEIEPKVWGTTTPSSKFEVRELPDGAPGLFDADGALLLHLLPELVVDAGPTGKRRPKPTTKRFELIKLTPNDDGGFALYARLQDQNARAYDLRIENGPHDPRIHVGVTTKWARDVTVHRELVRFRTGPLSGGHGLGHDYRWASIEEEWTGPVHTNPHAVRWDGLSVVGRSGTENIVARATDDGRWDIELEVYHHENHPVRLGEACELELDGAGQFGPNDRIEMRADFVVGAVDLPMVMRYPEGRPAAVALADSREGAARAFMTPDAATPTPRVVARSTTWLGETVDDLPCAEGRFKPLAAKGVSTMWSGETMVSSGSNLLAPTETDGRRAFAFRHPGISVQTLFALSDDQPDAGWMDASALARLRDDRGLLVARTPLEAFLDRDASESLDVRGALTAAATDGTIWLAGIDELANRLNAIEAVDLDVLPEGVVRVRNVGDTDLTGLTLTAPEGATARYETGVAHQNAGATTWFDLAARQDRLVQFFKGDEPAWSMQPADISVSYEPVAKPDESP